MPGDTEPNERLVQALLAAQAAALSDRIAASSVVETLWRSTDMLEELTTRIAELCADRGLADAALAIGGMLDDYAFIEAQRFDTIRQMAECLVTALQRVATPDPPSAGDIADLYCCDDQRVVHEQVIRQFAGNAK